MRHATPSLTQLCTLGNDLVRGPGAAEQKTVRRMIAMTEESPAAIRDMALEPQAPDGPVDGRGPFRWVNKGEACPAQATESPA